MKKDKLYMICEKEFKDIKTVKECDKVLKVKADELTSADGKYRSTLLRVIDILLDKRLELSN